MVYGQNVVFLNQKLNACVKENYDNATKYKKLLS
jgi:hypothetical protein